MAENAVGPDIGRDIKRYVPYIKFMPTKNELMDLRANMGIVNNSKNTDKIASLK